MALMKSSIKTIIAEVLNPYKRLQQVTPAGIFRREIAKQTIGRIRALGRKDISGADVLRSLRSEGLGIRSQDFYKQWRHAKPDTLETESPTTKPHVPNIPDSMPGAGEYHPPFPGQRRTYVYEFKMDMWDYVEGKWGPKPFRFSSSKRMKPITAFEEFYKKFEHAYDPTEVDWTTATYVRTYKR